MVVVTIRIHVQLKTSYNVEITDIRLSLKQAWMLYLMKRIKYVPCSSDFEYAANYNDSLYLQLQYKDPHTENWSACSSVWIDITEGILHMKKASHL